MSGEPVISKRYGDQVVACGINMSDFSLEEKSHRTGSGRRALAQMLWPCMAITVRHAEVDGKARPVRLLELARRGLLVISATLSCTSLEYQIPMWSSSVLDSGNLEVTLYVAAGDAQPFRRADRFTAGLRPLLRCQQSEALSACICVSLGSCAEIRLGSIVASQLSEIRRTRRTAAIRILRCQVLTPALANFSARLSSENPHFTKLVQHKVSR